MIDEEGQFDDGYGQAGFAQVREVFEPAVFANESLARISLPISAMRRRGMK